MIKWGIFLLDSLLEGGEGGGGGAPTDPGGAPGGQPNPAPTPQGIDWDAFVKTLPEDLRQDASLQPIKDPVSLVKSYVSAQKMIGKDKIQIPDAKHATEEDWMRVFRKLGAPEKPEDFKFKMPDGAKEEEFDAAFLQSLKEAAVKSGVLPHQFEKLFGAYYGYAKGKHDTSMASLEKTRGEDLKTLQTDWGQAFDTNVKKANVALRELVKNGEDRQRLIDDGLGSHPVILKILAGASKLMKEDTFISHGEAVGSGLTPAEALEKARSIQADSSHPYRNPSHPNHRSAKDEVSNLYKIAFPN